MLVLVNSRAGYSELCQGLCRAPPDVWVIFPTFVSVCVCAHAPLLWVVSANIGNTVFVNYVKIYGLLLVDIKLH